MQKFITSQYQRIKTLYAQYERLLMPATLVVGFLVDYFTFANIKITITFTLLLIYWLITGAIIFFINFYDTNKLPKNLKYVRLFAPLIIQFTFGALLGSSLVFYWLSGALSVSWPIILIIVLLMIFNDIFRHYFLNPVIQVGIYFFTTLSLFSLILPFLFNSLSPWLFILAGAVSIIIFYLYIKLLLLAGEHIKQKRRHVLIFVSAILIVMNFLYFANIIPPIPLSLREAGLYHSIKIFNGSYAMTDEIENFWQKLTPQKTVHVKPGKKIYFYTAIFAPTKLQTTIIHHWQYYDREKKNWIDQGELSFSIIGGRKEGYKGYSFLSNLASGTWRIYVKNQRGQVLGRIKFNVENTNQEIKLQETFR